MSHLEAYRTRLRAVAHRMLGSLSEADDFSTIEINEMVTADCKLIEPVAAA